jgi:NAD dependent epimerase/dehydratase family enzyme
MVMSPETGGAFDRLLYLVRLGLGGKSGSGNQFVSWIHDADFVRAVEFLIARRDIQGPVNICSPCPIPNRIFMRCLRHAWCTTYFGLPAPRWILALVALAISAETELILKSRWVVPGVLVNEGFEFHFPNWRSAAQDLVHRWRELHADAGLSAAAM